MPVFGRSSGDDPSLEVNVPLPQAPQVIEIAPTLAAGTQRAEEPQLVSLPSTAPASGAQPLTLPALSASPLTTTQAFLPLQSFGDAAPVPQLQEVRDIDSPTVRAAAQPQFVEGNVGSNVQGSNFGAGGFPEATPSSVQAFAVAISNIESSGNYRAVGPPTRFGTAKGRYQFIDETWQRAARLIGVAGQYPTALHAPNAVQDQVAAAWFSSLLDRYDGNFSAVAVAHHAGEGTADRFIRTGTVNTADVLGTQTIDYARRVVADAFG